MGDSNMDERFAAFVLNRLGYGPTPGDLQNIPKRNLNAWLEEQLSPPEGDDAGVKARIAAAQYRIHYNAKDSYPAVDEMRPLQSLDKPIEELWPLLDKTQPRDGAERTRPRVEVMAVTCIRAAYSQYQLREAVVAFWHDHFNVNANAGDQIAIAFPTYDRDVIRRHALGNFREMLEAVATSTAMLYYLSNHASRAGAANENYARELFELHTLGRDAYLNDHYDRWKNVPGALKGKPVGYIDQDVYEAARAFTGWTVEDGANLDNQRKLPATGKFTYVETWHDGYQKRVLAQDFDPFATVMADGRKVLDLVANHPATARHVVGKLCQRFIGSNTSAVLMDKLINEWHRLAKSPHQIAQVISLIAQSSDFANSQGSKVKRPLALGINFVRITGIDFTPTEGFMNTVGNGGQHLFAYGPPTGLPDTNSYFLNTADMRSRWALLLGLAQNSWQTGVCNPARVMPYASNVSAGDYIGQWLNVFGAMNNPETIASITSAIGTPPTAMVRDLDEKKLATGVAVAAMSPGFQSA